MSKYQLRWTFGTVWRASGMLLACAIGCNSPTVANDLGPPAGYALVAGTVRHAAGGVVPSADVIISGCPGVDGELGIGLTDDVGHYRILGKLPPVSLFPGIEVDTLRLKCYFRVNLDRVPRDSLLISFRTDSAGPVQTLNLTVP